MKTPLKPLPKKVLDLIRSLELDLSDRITLDLLVLQDFVRSAKKMAEVDVNLQETSTRLQLENNKKTDKINMIELCDKLATYFHAKPSYDLIPPESVVKTLVRNPASFIDLKLLRTSFKQEEAEFKWMKDANGMDIQIKEDKKQGKNVVSLPDVIISLERLSVAYLLAQLERKSRTDMSDNEKAFYEIKIFTVSEYKLRLLESDMDAFTLAKVDSEFRGKFPSMTITGISLDKCFNSKEVLSEVIQTHKYPQRQRLGASGPGASRPVANPAYNGPTRHTDKRGTIPCIDFKAGLCQYGASCRFNHGEVPTWGSRSADQGIKRSAQNQGRTTQPKRANPNPVTEIKKENGKYLKIISFVNYVL